MSSEKAPLFNKLTSKVPGVIFQFKMSADGKTSIPFANERLWDVFGIEPKDVEYDAEPIFEKVFPDDLAPLYNSIEVSRNNLSDWDFEFRICKNANEIRWLRGVARPEKSSDECLIWHGYILDVTERYLVENDNLETRIKYKGYFDNARDGLFVVNREGYYTEANPAACAMTGFSISEILSMHVKDLVDPDFNEDEKKTFQRTFDLGSVDEDVLLRRKSGESFWVRLVTSKINENFIIAFCHDITHRKLQEKKLKLQLAFQKLMASISSGFVNATNDSFDNTVNAALEQCGSFFVADRCYVFLFASDYLTMTNTHEWCSSGTSPQIKNLQNFETSQVEWWWDQIKNKRSINITDIINHPGLGKFEKDLFVEQQIKSLLSIPMINNGVLMGFFGLDRVNHAAGWSEDEISQFNLIGEIISSVFSKSRAEGALRLSESRYRLLAENARDVIYRVLLHPEKRYEYISPSSFNLTGYTPDEFYKDGNLINKIIHPDDLNWREMIYQDVMNFEKPIVLRMNCKDGRQIWCEQSNVPFFDDDGNLIAIEGIARDITEQKEFEKRLKELNVELLDKKKALETLNQSLEQRIAIEVDKNRELDQLMALQSRQAALGEMIANIAHQWRQPLNVISLAIFDLADAFEFEELDKEYMDNTVTEMNRVIQEMSKTIDDFRNFFKPESEKSVFTFAQVLNNSLAFMSSYFEKEKIKINRDLPPDVTVMGYSTQIDQVVISLLKNAIDALGDVAGREREICIKTRMVDKTTCVLEIINNGNHIPDDHFPRLFDPYFTTKPEGKGVGLGLYVAKTIVEKNMGGKIYCDNIDRGVKFTVILNSGNPIQ